MTLTLGTGPFSDDPAGVFNFKRPRDRGVIYFDDYLRRMRAEIDGAVIVDSSNAKILHEQGKLPQLYFPPDDVDLDLLTATDLHTVCPFKGTASYWSITTPERTVENAVWAYPNAPDDLPELAGYMALYWDRMDRWLEEDRPAIGHARDPYHRVDCLPTTRSVTVRSGDTVLAESSKLFVIFETGLPPRWYFPREDVAMELLQATEQETVCAYKGVANYWSAQVDSEHQKNIAWSYADPRPEVNLVADHIAFFDERLDVEVDGVVGERPATLWS